MKKKVFGRKFSRDYGSRQALLRALTRSLILNGSIKTTHAKAKGLQPDIDALVNLVKNSDVAKLRQAFAIVGNDRETLGVLVGRVAPVFINRTSGYTRIVPLPPRAGDSTREARLEWVEKIEIKTGKLGKVKEEKEDKGGSHKKVSLLKKVTKRTKKDQEKDNTKSPKTKK